MSGLTILRSGLALAACAVLVGGCAKLELSHKIPLPGQDDKPQTPQRMTALWTDTVLVEAGVVGFGGRIMFHGRHEEESIKVDGELTVYAYDDTGDVGQDSKPARKYVFRSEELSKHYSKSTLGHSYSFWLPWDKVGGPRHQISLIARFKSNGGGVVMSEMTRHLLPGSDPEGSPDAHAGHAHAAHAAHAVTQAAHHEPPAAPAELPAKPEMPGMSTATIALSEGMRESVQNGASDPSTVPADLTAPGAMGGGELRTPAASASQMDSAEIQSMVRQAVREAMAHQAAPPADRFARQKPRARIEPRQPPTRGPGRSLLHPAGPPSGLPSPLPSAAATGSELPLSAAPATMQLP